MPFGPRLERKILATVLAARMLAFCASRPFTRFLDSASCFSASETREKLGGRGQIAVSTEFFPPFAVDEGAGRRYRVDNASPGFLNVHTAPDDPFRTDNVVTRLMHNDIVESVSERGAWVEHDGGGWSIREYGGHRYLVPVND